VSETYQTQIHTRPSDLGSLFAEADKGLSRERQQARQQVVRLLTPAQAKRLEQISLQDSGATALFRPDVLQTLGISREQQRRLAEIRDKAKEEVAALHGLTRNVSSDQPLSVASPQSVWDTMQGWERRMMEEVLTAEQQTKLKELQGAPFAFPANYRPPMPSVGVSGGSGGGSSRRY